MEVADALRGTAVQLVAVNFDTPDRVARYAAAFGRGVQFLCDPERELYGRLGIGRASRARVWLHPAVWLAYARILRSGTTFRSAAGDTQQLGGDVVLDTDLTPVWTYRGRGPEDRPAATDVARHALVALSDARRRSS